MTHIGMQAHNRIHLFCFGLKQPILFQPLRKVSGNSMFISGGQVCFFHPSNIYFPKLQTLLDIILAPARGDFKTRCPIRFGKETKRNQHMQKEVSRIYIVYSFSLDDFLNEVLDLAQPNQARNEGAKRPYGLKNSGHHQVVSTPW